MQRGCVQRGGRQVGPSDGKNRGLLPKGRPPLFFAARSYAANNVPLAFPVFPAADTEVGHFYVCDVFARQKLAVSNWHGCQLLTGAQILLTAATPLAASYFYLSHGYLLLFARRSVFHVT